MVTGWRCSCQPVLPAWRWPHHPRSWSTACGACRYAQSPCITHVLCHMLPVFSCSLLALLTVSASWCLFACWSAYMLLYCHTVPHQRTFTHTLGGTHPSGPPDQHTAPAMKPLVYPMSQVACWQLADPSSSPRRVPLTATQLVQIMCR